MPRVPAAVQDGMRIVKVTSCSNTVAVAETTSTTFREVTELWVASNVFRGPLAGALREFGQDVSSGALELGAWLEGFGRYAAGVALALGEEPGTAEVAAWDGAMVADAVLAERVGPSSAAELLALWRSVSGG